MRPRTTHRSTLAGLLLALMTLAPSGGRAQSCWRVVPLLTLQRSSPACSTRYLDTGLLQDSERVSRAIEAGQAASSACYQQQLSRETTIASQHPVMINTPEYHHYLTQTPLPFWIENYNLTMQDVCLAQEVAKAFAQEFGVSRGAAGEAMPLLNVTAPSSVIGAIPEPACNASSPYRNINGTCNNLQEPLMGLTSMPYIRLLPPDYADGIYAERRARSGNPLPSARLLRLHLIGVSEWPSLLLSLNAMQWGQLVAHDIMLSVDTAGVSGLGVECCAINDTAPTHRLPLPPSELPMGCLPVNGPRSYCLSLARANATFADADGHLATAEQINAVSHWIDASPVYGSNEALAAQLRNGTTPFLLESPGGFLPLASNPAATCDARRDTNVCYQAGDARVNQNTGITALQTLMMREHNRQARALSALNPQWSDERVFQETRRLIIAELQHITYSGLLPLYLGPEYVQYYGLLSPGQGYDTRGYNPQVDGSTINSFASAAYRIFHGLARSFIDLVSPASLCPVASVRMASWFDTPSVLTNPPEHFDQVLLGLAMEPAQAADDYYPEAIINHMFETNSDPGQDLATFDIQRSRDFGLPPYVVYRELCGGGRIRSWNDVASDFSSEALQGMMRLYEDVRDVDLYVGLFLEIFAGSAPVGPTARCIIGEQFYRKKFGDRFFYTFGGQAGSFTEGQLNEIKKVTLSRLLCDNGDNITHIPLDSFLQKNAMNPIVSCDYIPSMNLNLWKE